MKSRGWDSATLSRGLTWVVMSLVACWMDVEDCRADEIVKINVYPTIRRQIDGVCELNRTAWFAMCDHGSSFDQRVRSSERMAYLLGELGASFGRSLGPIRNAIRREGVLREDPQRPGFADVEHLREQVSKRRKEPNRAFARFVGGRLDVASHGSKNVYPEFMGVYTTPQASEDPDHSQRLPDNVEAAAELAATVLKYAFTDFERPRYFEPVNEPHWSFTSGEKLADWHLKAHAAVHAADLDLKVGGPCSSVAYFYRNEFKAFDGLKNFIRNTNCELDFYSFHAYDYLRWNGEDLVGRITSGLPLEGMLDLVQAHTHNEYGKPVDIVVSEQGGYITGGGDFPGEDEVGDLLAAKYFPDGEGFDHTMEKRSISSNVLVSSAIANTLAFMEHPHVVKKAVPFILLESMAWDPKYYSTLYVPYDFSDRRRWEESRNLDYYKFFRDLEGERVAVTGGDPDLQTRAFAHENKLMVVINNLSDVRHVTDLKLPPAEKLQLRRYGRGEDFRPYLRDEAIDSVNSLEIAGREAILLTATYDRNIPSRSRVNEIPCYGHAVTLKPTAQRPARFLVEVPDVNKLGYASLRICVARPPGADPNLLVKLNGKRLEVPLEDAAARYDDGDKEYASTKIFTVDRKLVRKKNRVEVSFPGDEGGVVGSVVLRAGVKE